MSDEPPPLRLKPRIRPPEGEAAGAAPAPPGLPPPPPPAPEGADIGRLRLKPKLSVEAAAEPAATSEEPPPPPRPPLPRSPQPEATFASPFAAEVPPPPAPEPLAPPPTFSIPPPPPPVPGVAAEGSAGEAPRFKLKPKGAPAGGSAAAAPPPPPAIAIPPPTGAVFEAPTPPPEKGRMTMPPFPTAAAGSRPPIAVPAELDKSILTAGVLAPKPKSQFLKKAAVAAGVLCGFVLIFVVYRMFFAPLPKPVINTVRPIAVAKPKPPVVAPPPPAAPPPVVTPTPVAASAAPAVAATDARPVLAPASPAPKPAEHVVVTSSTDLGSGIKATTTEVSDGPAASAAFLQWVDTAKIGGVFQGNPPRALINGKIARLNQTVDDDLGITFDGVDAENRQVIFKDKTGATANKRY